MENASKALIMAGAVLISIVLISLGVMVLRQSSSTVDSGTKSMTSAEISAYNSKWESYVGNNKRGSEIKQLISKVNTHNRTNKGDSSRQIDVIIRNTAGALPTGDLSGDVATISSSSVNNGWSYKVEATYNSGAVVNRLVVTKTST